MQEPRSVSTAASRIDPRLAWVIPFAAALGIQGFLVERSGAAVPMMDVANVLAYGVALLLTWALMGDDRIAPAAEGAGADLRWTDWLGGTPALFRSPRFRSFVPALTGMALAGVFAGAGTVLVLAGRGDRTLGELAGMGALLIGMEIARYTLMWLVTVFLLCLSSVLVTGGTDFRYMAALLGYGYLALPVAIWIALVYQFAFFPNAAGSDPEVMVPAAVLLKAAEVWAVFAVARGLRHADPRRPLSAPTAMLVAVLPFILLTAARMLVRVVAS